MHGEQRGHAVESGAVADTRRDGDDRSAGEAAEHARECALHSGDDDQRVGLGQVVEASEQPVQAGHAHIGHDGRIEAVGAQGQCCFVGHGDVAGSGGHDGDPSRAGGLRKSPDHAPARFDGWAVSVEAGAALRVVGARQQHRARAVCEEFPDDGDALRGALAGPVDRLG